jgi:K319L-like, PKD domain
MKNFIVLVFLICASSLDAQQVRVSNRNSSLTVNAGADQSITLPSSAPLAGKVVALPSRTATSINWTVASGPGTVRFANPRAAETSADFSAPGSYVLALNASTSKLNATSKTTITVNPAVPVPPSTSITVAMAWDPVANATSYNVWRLPEGGEWLKIAAALTVTSFTDSGLVAGIRYYYGVTAVNEVGESSSSNLVSFDAQ